ncbi:hypothetical protein J7T55_003102 [Diaporthe amygdali]|uniref:uncharacterized protein n=1 Tax=Phomopsis amygdali TaxID=1214568 RepID=UPI0022FE97F2|nr:uncharacterized protein J7T55_003102 [Diaporthe amygdali]KAJ0122588.1 hypothetical protein J7T55_003102 [Diaporthe amygdali]
MAADSSVNKLSKLPPDHMSPDRPSQPLVLSPPATSDVLMGPSVTQRPPAETFTLFKLLPSELRLRVWEFACAAPGPRIHFLEPIVDSDGAEEGQKMRWEVTKSKDDPSFRWSGQELLDVCIEARSVCLKHKTTGNSLGREQSHNSISDMVQTSDIVCVRIEKTNNGIFVSPSNPRFGRVEKQFCDRDKRPSPRLLALELPLNPPNQHGWWYPLLVPSWSSYGDVQNLLQLDQLDVIYILDQHIKPRDDCNNQPVIAPEKETEVFEGHLDSKFISINPEDDHALHTGVSLASVGRFFKIILLLRVYSPGRKWLGSVSRKSSSKAPTTAALWSRKHSPKAPRHQGKTTECYEIVTGKVTTMDACVAQAQDLSTSIETTEASTLRNTPSEATEDESAEKTWGADEINTIAKRQETFRHNMLHLDSVVMKIVERSHIS